MNDRGPITCRDTTWLVSDARERELTGEERSALKEHICGCELCQGASKQFEVLFAQIDFLLAKSERR